MFTHKIRTDMILISVKSEVVDDKRQFKSDRKALTFLRRINNLHLSHRLKLVGPKPKRVKGKGMKRYNEKRIAEWQTNLRTCIPLRIEIINTEANQLNLQLK